MTPHTHRVNLSLTEDGFPIIEDVRCALLEGTCVVDRVRKLAEELEKAPGTHVYNTPSFARRLRECLEGT